MHLTIGQRQYLDRRNQIMSDPAQMIQGFEDQWLRVVGAVGQTPDSCSWLITTRQADELDDYNLNLANEGLFPLDLDYFVLDPEMANQVLKSGVQKYGIEFLFDFGSNRVEYAFREVLT